MALIYQDKVSGAFANKVIDISKRLDFNPNWLMQVIKFESAGSFSPSKTNHIGCVGLIQFCPDVPRGSYKTFGSEKVSMERLKNMSALEQLDYVEKYYKPFSARITRYVDLYLLTILPISVGKPDDFVMEAKNISAQKFAQQNPAFGKKDRVTVGDIKRYMLNLVPKEWMQRFGEEFTEVRDSAVKFAKRNKALVAVSAIAVIAATAAGIYYVLKK